MQTYFLGLFATAAVLVGLGAGFLLAFGQIASGRFSPLISTLALSDWAIRACLVVMTVIMILLGAAALILSLPPPRPIVLSLGIDLERAIAGAGGLGLLVASLLALAFLSLRAAGYTNGPGLAVLLVNRVKLPRDLELMDDPSRDPADAYPFLAVFELVNQAIRDGDRATFGRALLTIRSRLPDWIGSLPDTERRTGLIALRDGLLADLPDLIARNNVYSLHRIYLPELTLMAQAAGAIRADLLPVLLDLAEANLIKLILGGEDEAAAPGVASLFGLEEALTRDPRPAEEVHKALGSIGRAVGQLLPSRLGYAFNAPGFGYMDDSRSEVMQTIRQGYGELAERIERSPRPEDSYIWMEAIEVTILSLLERGIETRNYHAVSEHIEDLLLDLTLVAPEHAYAGSDLGLQRSIFAVERLSREGFAVIALSTMSASAVSSV